MIECGKCQQVCFVDAIEWIGKMTVSEVMEEIKDILYDQSEGGTSVWENLSCSRNLLWKS